MLQLVCERAYGVRMTRRLRIAGLIGRTRPDLNAELKDTARAVRVRGFRFGLRAGLVVVQVALSLALMIGAALMLRSPHAGRTEDPRFRRHDVLSVGINLSTVPDRSGAHARFYRDALRGVAALPGVEQVALAALVPLDGIEPSDNDSDRRAVPPISPRRISTWSASYFALLEIPVKQGREFTIADRESSPRVAVVNDMTGAAVLER